jgi:hypothetical protein
MSPVEMQPIIHQEEQRDIYLLYVQVYVSVYCGFSIPSGSLSLVKYPLYSVETLTGIKFITWT